MAFKVGDKVEVYRRQDIDGYPLIDKGLKGRITRIKKCEPWGTWAQVCSLEGLVLRIVPVKLTYLKHVKE